MKQPSCSFSCRRRTAADELRWECRAARAPNSRSQTNRILETPVRTTALVLSLTLLLGSSASAWALASSPTAFDGGKPQTPPKKPADKQKPPEKKPEPAK